MKYSELKDKSHDELVELHCELKKELMNLRFQRVVGDLEKNNRFKEVKKDVARILTCLTSQKLLGENNA